MTDFPHRTRLLTLPNRRWPIILGTLAFFAVALLGGLVVATRPGVYIAEASVVVVPSKDVSVGEAAGLFDTLSRGQVAATAAEILEQPRWRRGAPDVVVTAGSVPPSSVIKVTATGTNQSQVVEVLSEIVSLASPEINTLLDPYRVERLDTIGPEVKPIGLTKPLQFVLVALAALFAAGVLYQLTSRAVRWAGRPGGD